MESVNQLRAVLVAGAALAAVVAAVLGFWAAALLLGVGVGAHAMLWRHLRRSGTTPAGPLTPPREPTA